VRSIILRDDGRPHRIISTMIDITERILIEQALRDHTAALERSNLELERFAQIASHDLQEPLRTISSFVQLLSTRYGDKLDENGARYMRYVVDGAGRMRALINALLAYSRVDRADAPVTAEISLTALMAHVRADLRASLTASRAVLTCDELPIVLGNEIQLSQLLSNIIGNALKYQAPGAVPRVHVSAAREGAHWKLAIADNGIGIEAQYFEKIFVVLQRLHTREAYDGTGIGLAICKRIVERHGGKIWVESQPGVGSTFYFTLRAAAAASATAVPPAQTNNDTEGGTDAQPPA
jgi:light-regulated signal transduction histidine kinase (bacteriophytochrome)